jgi:hypothetical protein
MIKKLLLVAAALAGLIGLPAVSASAMPMSGLQSVDHSSVQDVRWHGHWHGGWHRHWRRHRHW